MCGRFVLEVPFALLAQLYGVGRLPSGLEVSPAARPRYNIAPMQSIATVWLGPTGPEFSLRQWGFVPAYAKDPLHPGPQGGPPAINARAETLLSGRMFREGVKARRCVVPASGFYEWKKLDESGKQKQPMYIRPAAGMGSNVLSLAAVASVWTGGGAAGVERTIESVAIVTTAANRFMGTMHERMPAILQARDVGSWLDTRNVSEEEAAALLKAAPEDWLEAHAVGIRVNSARNEGADLIREADADQDSIAPAPKGSGNRAAKGKQNNPPGETLWG